MRRRLPVVAELDRQLNLNESVLRTKIIRPDEKVGDSMAGDTVITVVGNLTADPELRFTASGAAVANFTVASTPRTFDRATGEWKDGEALFLRCNIWRQAAENVAESLTRGARVIVTGRLKQRSFDTKEGEKRTVIELEVDEVGPSLRYATAKVNRGPHRGRRWRWLRRSAGGRRGVFRQARERRRGGSAAAHDPWGSAPRGRRRLLRRAAVQPNDCSSRTPFLLLP